MTSRIKPILVLLLAAILLSAPPKAQAASQRDTLRICAIGNSFSDDAILTHLYELFDSAGIPVILGNAYIGGCTLERHYNNARQSLPAYTYRKIVRGKQTDTQDSSLDFILSDEPWQFLSFQQSSPLSGIYDSYKPFIGELIKYARGKLKSSTKLMWQMTWAYAHDSTHKDFPSYGNDQMRMYNAIIDATSKVLKDNEFDILLPSGTAIQNARTTPLRGRLTRDGYHLSLDYGRFIAACTWFESITGRNVTLSSYKPSAMRDEEAKACKHSAHRAVRRPYSISKIKSR